MCEKPLGMRVTVKEYQKRAIKLHKRDDSNCRELAQKKLLKEAQEYATRAIRHLNPFFNRTIYTIWVKTTIIQSNGKHVIGIISLPVISKYIWEQANKKTTSEILYRIAAPCKRYSKEVGQHAIRYPEKYKKNTSEFKDAWMLILLYSLSITKKNGFSQISGVAMDPTICAKLLNGDTVEINMIEMYKQRTYLDVIVKEKLDIRSGRLAFIFESEETIDLLDAMEPLDASKMSGLKLLNNLKKWLNNPIIPQDATPYIFMTYKEDD